jgi:outer membrane protein TolC
MRRSVFLSTLRLGQPSGLAAGLAAGLLAACVSSPVDAVGNADGLRQRLAEQTSAPAGDFARGHAASGWWTALADPALDALVAAGEAGSLDLAQAVLRADEAAAGLRATRSAGRPAIGAEITFEDAANSVGAAEIGLDADWQVDLFGRARAATSAADARAGAAQFATENVRRLMIAGIVSTYLNLRTIEADIAASRASAARLESALGKITRLSAAGYATALDVARSRCQLYDVRARLADLDGRRRAAENALQLLVGRPPAGSFGAPSAAAPLAVPDLVIPTPDAVFAARPDVTEAYLALMSAAAEARGARRALWPDLTLNVRAFETDAARSALDFAGIESEIVGRLAAPLLFRGRQLAGIDIADARLAAAAVRYEQVLLTALSEVDTALAEIRAFRAAAGEADAARTAAEQALVQSQRLFEAGEIAYLDVLLAEEAALDADRAARTATRNAELAWVRYMSALGVT